MSELDKTIKFILESCVAALKEHERHVLADCLYGVLHAFETGRTQPEATKPAQDLSAVETHGAAAQPIGQITGISEHDGEATIGLYDFVVGVGDLVYAIPHSGAGAALGIAHKALEKISTWSFGWDGDCGVRNVADDALADIEAALASPADALVAGDRVDPELLRKLRDYIDQKSKEYGYGFYRPTNPHDFTPDADQCSEDEIAAHKAACEAFDKGEYTHDYSGCLREGGMHILHAPWGVGSYAIRDPEVQELLDAINAAIQAQKDGHG